MYTLRKEDYEENHESKIEQGYVVLKMNKALYESNNTFKNIDFYNQNFRILVFTGSFLMRESVIALSMMI